MESGVYCIKNLVNGKVYIGSASRCLSRRMGTHRRLLLSGKHPNQRLQRAWNKYGAESFSFFAIEWCVPDDCVKHEQFWINNFDSVHSNKGYNISPTAGSSRGTRMTDEQKSRYKIAAKKRMESAEYKKKSVANFRCMQERGHTRSDSCKSKISQSLRGKKQSEDTISKRVQSLKGKKRTPEQIARLSAAALGNRENRRRAAMIRWYGKKEE